ncbi:FDLD family class I lanthipeptide [Nocardia brasiliensis]|uniref:FDLD family class I lanthipeptide n=1 Tax=Nocardia brasiliensis TaxID=37326 RepID=UPI0004A72AED|nr:FDLD family class I lanthipeptide [Nocardia brasiliensis]
MSAPVDDFDLDIRIGDPTRVVEPGMVTKTTDAEWCSDSHCPTCGTTCPTHHGPRCTDYC